MSREDAIGKLDPSDQESTNRPWVSASDVQDAIGTTYDDFVDADDTVRFDLGEDIIAATSEMKAYVDDAALTIGTVTTSESGSPAEAEIVGNVPNKILNLTLPRGEKGEVGDVFTGIGADGTLCVADSNEVTGVRWAQVADANLADGAVTTAKLADGAVTFAKTSKVAPVSLLASKPAINGYVGPAFGTTGVGEVQRHNSFFCGIWLHPGTLDRIGVEVTTAQASTTVRLGIYGTSTDGLPTGAPILDAGTVDASTTGFKEITVSQAISAAGWYWLSATAQGGSGADVQVRRIIGGTRQPVAAIATRIVDASPAVVGIRTMGGTTSGALPTIGALNYGDSTTPQIVVRYSAVS